MLKSASGASAWQAKRNSARIRSPAASSSGWASARALMQNPKVILADEPVASLDPATAHSVLDHLEQMNKRDGMTVLCNLHFLSLARRYADRVVALKAGQIVFDGLPKEIDDERFKAIYGEEAVQVEIA